MCGRLGRRAGDDGGFPSWWSPLRGEMGGATACSLVRVGAFADELRLMGVERVVAFTLVGRMGGGVGSLSKKASRASGPLDMHGADVKRSLWGRCELHNAGCGERWASVVLPMRPCGVFGGEEL